MDLSRSELSGALVRKGMHKQAGGAQPPRGRCTGPGTCCANDVTKMAVASQLLQLLETDRQLG